MAGKGGYQRPKNPAMVSGPGKYSQRTDGGPGDLRQGARKVPSSAYGEGLETMQIQTEAPMSASGGFGGVDPQVSQGAEIQLPVTPLFAPSQRPDEPVTSGIDIGDGVGSSALGMRNLATEKLSDILAKMLPYDQTGEIEILYQRAAARGM
jgi:hypothetical protein